VRVVIIASGEPYQEAAAWAAPTYSNYLPQSDRLSVLLPDEEIMLDELKLHSKTFGFSLERFPFRPVSEKKFTSQLKCQAYVFAVSHLKKDELLFLVDADTCCFKPFAVSLKVKSAIRSGKIGLVPDIADHHSETPTDPWYLAPHERLPYVNSGVILTSKSALPLFKIFRELSERPDFLQGPFNDQKVINFALGKYFRDKLVLLDRVYNRIGEAFSEDTIIGHCAGGAGWLGTQKRKVSHQNICAGLLGAPINPTSHRGSLEAGAARSRVVP